MNDLISRKYVIEQIEKAKKEGKVFNYDTLVDFIRVLPPAAIKNSAEEDDGK